MVLARTWDVLVVGGGHAGCEAAAAAARCGARTLLVTHDARTIGAMSCNPAIGGIGKGHLVREVDALDGLMARAADAAGIHFKLLNRSKGPAVRGPRVQADRARFAAAVQGLLRETPGLSVHSAAVQDLVVDGHGRVTGIRLGDGVALRGGAVVLTTGTFLGGEIHIGDERFPAGRWGEPAASGLSAALAGLGLPLARLKTGTPPRLDGRTVDWDEIERQSGDTVPEPLSWLSGTPVNEQIACGITWTDSGMHQFIQANLGSSAVYGGHVSGRGPRYCPSIEDKIVRFPDKLRHQIFLEPESLDGGLVYPNGLSTSLPEAHQQEMVRRLPGLRRAMIVKPGYAIEYDHVDPRALLPTFEVRSAIGLFLAGQINGTTGYEEAAAQGVMAGLNAACRAAGAVPDRVILRDEGYIGVLADDLTLQGVSEPYRMLTARAEHRLHLRADNATLRLTGKGMAWGCVGRERSRRFCAFSTGVDTALERAHSSLATPHELAGAGIRVPQDGRRRSAFEVLGLPDVRLEAAFSTFPWLVDLPPHVMEELANRALYAPYLDRNRGMLDLIEREERLPVPPDLDFTAIPGLSLEMRQRLTGARPSTLGAAGRVAGVTPAAVAALAVHLRRCFT